MRFIRLTKGKRAIVDDEDYDFLIKRKWCAKKGTAGCWYAVRTTYCEPKPQQLWMHREIMRPPKNRVVDHINGNGLDNRRKNLRVCTSLENCQNQTRLNKRNKTGFSCIRQRKCGCWSAIAIINNERFELGNFLTKKRAIQARKLFLKTRERLIEERSCKNPSGFKGVCWLKDEKKWRASLWINRKFKSLGFFSSKKKALIARRAARAKMIDADRIYREGV